MIEFGIPSKRSKILKNLYTVPVVTVLSRPNITGAAYRLIFERIKAFRIFANNKISILSYTNDDDPTHKVNLCFVQEMDLPKNEKAIAKVGLNGNLNNQKIWNYIREIFKVPEAEFQLVLQEQFISLDPNNPETKMRVFVMDKYVAQIDDSPSDITVEELTEESVEESLSNDFTPDINVSYVDTSSTQNLDNVIVSTNEDDEMENFLNSI